ncbi:hypothetical protein PIB30_115676, partial [Stylosanthes scabra]|nr:hypothetical protein [Stylosanthes scabra]
SASCAFDTSTASPLLSETLPEIVPSPTTTMSLSCTSAGASSIRILVPVDCWRLLMTEPDFPMTPPIREAWQRRRNATWPCGTESGGG